MNFTEQQRDILSARLDAIKNKKITLTKNKRSMKEQLISIYLENVIDANCYVPESEEAICQCIWESRVPNHRVIPVEIQSETRKKEIKSLLKDIKPIYINNKYVSPFIYCSDLDFE